LIFGITYGLCFENTLLRFPVCFYFHNLIYICPADQAFASLGGLGLGLLIEPGDLLGEVRNGAASIPVRSPFRGWVMAHLAWEGELVTPGQILLSLRPF